MNVKRCPSKDEFIRFLEERAPRGEGWEFLAHVLSCPDCLAAFGAAEEVRSQSQDILRGLEGVDLRSRESRRRLRSIARRELRLLRQGRGREKPRIRRWTGLSAVGAALVLVAILINWPSTGRHREKALERSVPLPEITLMEPRGQVGGRALSFKWAPLPGARGYRLEVYDRALGPVYQSGPLASAGVSLSGAALAPILKNEVYFWKIVAVTSDNQTVESEFARFILSN